MIGVRKVTAEGVHGGERGEEKGMPVEETGGDEESVEMLAEVEGSMASVRSQEGDALWWGEE